MQPRPRFRHARAKSFLSRHIGGPYDMDADGPGGWWILPEPGIELPRSPEVSPDVAGWRRDRMPAPPPEGDPITLVPDSMSQESGLKAYTGTFARQGQGQARTMAVKRVTAGKVDGDVAEIEVVLAFQSWPQWVSIVIALSFVLFRPAVLIGAVLYFVTRKRREVSVTKTLLRGRDGAWYVYDADVLEGAAEG